MSSTVITNTRVDLSIDKTSSKSRVDRANVVLAMATKTALYQTDPSFKAVVDKLGSAGAELEAAENEVTQAEATLVKARSTRDAKRYAYDKIHGVCAGNVEIHSVISQDVKGYGFAVLERDASGLTPPSSLAVKYDPAKGVIRVHVICTSRLRRCTVEISPDPAGAATFTRVEGTGARRSLPGYAPGTYWVRAATLSATAQSEWFGPVAVIVK